MFRTQVRHNATISRLREKETFCQGQGDFITRGVSILPQDRKLQIRIIMSSFTSTAFIYIYLNK